MVIVRGDFGGLIIIRAWNWGLWNGKLLNTLEKIEIVVLENWIRILGVFVLIIHFILYYN